MSRPPTLTAGETDAAHAAAQKVVEVHRALVAHIEPGMTTREVDDFIGEVLSDLGCRSCFMGYAPGRMPPFPSHACLSVNDCIVHGTGRTLRRPLRYGDLISVDIGVEFEGWIGDAAWTYSIGEPSPDARALMDAGKRSLEVGIETIKPGAAYMAWAQAVQGFVERERGLHLVRGLGGHGYGRTLHEPPFISNTAPSSTWEWPEAFNTWTPGVLVAVEPMLALGTGQTKQGARSWPIYTADGSLSVHYEADVLVTDVGPRVLTHGMADLPDVIG